MKCNFCPLECRATALMQWNAREGILPQQNEPQHLQCNHQHQHYYYYPDHNQYYHYQDQDLTCNARSRILSYWNARRLLQSNAMRRDYCEESHLHYWNVESIGMHHHHHNARCTTDRSKSGGSIVHLGILQGGKMRTLKSHPNFHHNEEFHN